MKRITILFVIFMTISMLFAVDVTFKVNMNYQIQLGNFDSSVDIVDVAGNFNDWSGSGAMDDADNDGIYTTMVENLDIDYVCEFKFRMNANWDTSEFPGGSNRTYTVVEGENVIEVWYNDQEQPSDDPAPITFIIDDSANQTHSTFYLKGSWDTNGVYDPSWGDGAEHAEFTDDGTNGDVTAGDHIFTAVVELYPDGGSHTWNWGVNDENHDWIDGNWAFNVTDISPQTLTYTIETLTTQDVMVTFSVDMSFVETIADTVWIAGDFNDWAGNLISLENNGNNIYTIYIVFPAGSHHYHEFKFINGAEWESIDNRSFMLDDSSEFQMLDLMYFNNIMPTDFTQQDVTVYFSVDMNAVTTIADTISLAGDFNTWQVGVNIMGDDDMDGIYTASILFPSGTLKHQEYKFVNGNEYESIENRVLMIDDSETEQHLDTVYFNNEEVNTQESTISVLSNLNIYPNPFITGDNAKSNAVNISFELTKSQNVEVKIFNLKGQFIKTIVNQKMQAGIHNFMWNGVDFQNQNVVSGVYLYRIKMGNNTLVKKITIVK